jgi:regulator of protease activity HflC (stomatin/prohibitin superfamily)
MSEPTFGLKGAILTVACIIAAIFVFGIFFCVTKVPANRFAVRTRLTGSGLEKKDYPPGYVVCIPGFHNVALWDTTWSNLKVQLPIRASDQYTTTVDVSVLWRVAIGKCYIAAGKYRNEEHAEQLVRQTLSKHANEILATLKTEDFYSSDKRIAMSKQTEAAMRAALSEDGLEITNLLLRNIVFDPKFEAQLLAKQLAGQQKDLSTAKGLMATAQTQTQLIQQSAQNAVKTINAEKEQEIQNLSAAMARDINNIAQDAAKKANEIVSKAKSDRRQKEAQAQYLKASAQALATNLLAKAYEQPGAPMYFATKAIESMKIDTIEINSSSFNPLETARMMEALGKGK